MTPDVLHPTDDFSLPEWAHRTLAVCGPGRPLAPSPAELELAGPLCPQSAAGLRHPAPELSWSAWSQPEGA